MKCDICKYRKFHSAGSWWSVAEGYDDPYNYLYCEKLHWSGDNTEPQDEDQVDMDDPWINCEDYIEE